MDHIPFMQTRSKQFAWLLPVLVALLAAEVNAGVWSRRVQYRNGQNRNAVRTPATNQSTRTKRPEEPEKPVKFRDIAVNAEFYFVADKDRKLFPRIKISETLAKSVPTAASPVVTTNPVPGETLVFVKKERPNKDTPKQGSEKNPPDGRKGDKKP